VLAVVAGVYLARKTKKIENGIFSAAGVIVLG